MGAAGLYDQGVNFGGTHGATCRHCLSPVSLGVRLLLVPQCSRTAVAGVSSQPLTVPLSRTCGPSCHQGLVPSALTGDDRWTRRGAGGGRKLLIPLYLPLALLSHLPVMLSISSGILPSYSCAFQVAQERELSQHPTTRHWPHSPSSWLQCRVSSPPGHARLLDCKEYQF